MNTATAASPERYLQADLNRHVDKNLNSVEVFLFFANAHFKMAVSDIKRHSMAKEKDMVKK